jgi:hypothetical protein
MLPRSDFVFAVQHSVDDDTRQHPSKHGWGGGVAKQTGYQGSIAATGPANLAWRRRSSCIVEEFGRAQPREYCSVRQTAASRLWAMNWPKNSCAFTILSCATGATSQPVPSDGPRSGHHPSSVLGRSGLGPTRYTRLHNSVRLLHNFLSIFIGTAVTRPPSASNLVSLLWTVFGADAHSDAIFAVPGCAHEKAGDG